MSLEGIGFLFDLGDGADESILHAKLKGLSTKHTPSLGKTFTYDYSPLIEMIEPGVCKVTWQGKPINFVYWSYVIFSGNISESKGQRQGLSHPGPSRIAPADPSKPVSLHLLGPNGHESPPRP